MKAAVDDDDFLAAVAEHFVKRRGRGAMLSPADLACLVEWERAGVGAAVAIRGIDEAFRRGGDIRSLRQCRRAVDEERRKSRRGSRKRSRGRLEEKSLNQKLAALTAGLEETSRAAANAGVAKAIRRAAAATQKLADDAAAKSADITQVQDALDEIEIGLLSEIEAALGPAKAAALKKETRGQLRGRELQADVVRRTAQAVSKRKLRERFRLPSFTI